MSIRSVLTASAALITMGLAAPACAQDAAEAAQILSGVGQSQGQASRSLGSAISQSMNSASAAIAASRSGGGGGHVSRGRRSHAAHGVYSVNSDADSLKGTDAPSYTLNNGASIRVSGGLVGTPQGTCEQDCPKDR